MNDPIVGIDLGTSNTVVAYADGSGTVEVLADDSGYKIHPSVVSFHPNGGVIVGASAKQRKVIDPQNTIYSAKRLIGRGFGSPEVQTAMSRVPYQIKEGANQAPLIVTRGGEFAVPEISAIVLDYVRNIAAARLESDVTRAVVTVPASFNDAQRSASATAGAIAGLTVVRVLNEPTAAALAYGHTRSLHEIIAVYDFGGGTFDITILKLADQVYEVLGTSGDTFLGGDDLDERLVDKMVAKFLIEHRIDLRSNEVSMMRLRAVSEQTKIELSRRSRAVVRVDEIAYGPKGVPLNLQIEISRDEFVSQIADIIDRTFPVCQEALTLAGLGVGEIDDVILVGGTTKIPYVRDQAARFFSKAPRADVNSEDAVAVGAALQAFSLERILTKHRPSSSLPTIPEDADLEEDRTTDTGMAEVQTMMDEAMSGFVPTDPVVTRPRRQTSGYEQTHRASTAAPKPDTSYSVKRSGARDHFEERAKPSAPNPTVEDQTPTPMASLGRLTRSIASRTARESVAPGPAELPTPPPTPLVSTPLVSTPLVSTPLVSTQKTAFGVPAAPDVRRKTGANPVIPPPIPQRSTRALPAQANPRAASTQDIPTLSPARALPDLEEAPTATLTLPPLPPTPARNSRPPLELEEAPTELAMIPLLPPGAPQPPLAPLSWRDEELLGSMLPKLPPIPSALPNARTMVGPVPGSIGNRVDSEFKDEQSASSTAKGFQPPQTYPVVMPYQQPLPVLLEVTPRSLGIATVAGFCEELIRRNSRLPTEMKKLFSTSRDSQDLVRIVVCQGESRRLDNNVVIGDLILQNLPPRPRGETSIEVTFALDASGILQVRARDPKTGTEQRATLELVGGIRQQDVAAARERIQQLRR